MRVRQAARVDNRSVEIVQIWPARKSSPFILNGVVRIIDNLTLLPIINQIRSNTVLLHSAVFPPQQRK